MKYVGITTVTFALLGLSSCGSWARWEAKGTFVDLSIGYNSLGAPPGVALVGERITRLRNGASIGFGGLARYRSETTSKGYLRPVGGGILAWNEVGTLKLRRLHLGAHGHYHFATPEAEQLDPFAGLVVGCEVTDEIREDVGHPRTHRSKPGRLWLAADAGVRYWLAPRLAAAGHLSLGRHGFRAVDGGLGFRF